MTRATATKSASASTVGPPRLDLTGPLRAATLALLGLAGASALVVTYAPFDRGLALAEATLVESTAQEVRHSGGGVMGRVMVQERHDITAGELIAVLDTTELDRQISDLKTQTAADQSQLELMRKEAQTFSDLLEQRLASRAKVETLEQHLAALENDSAKVMSRIAAAERQLANMEIRAPVSGTLEWVTRAGSGAILAPGDSLARIVPHPGRLVLGAKLPAEVARKVRAGMEMSVWLNALSWLDGRPMRAWIVWIAPVPENDPAAAIPVRLELATASAALAQHITIIPGLRGALVLRDGQRTFVEQLLGPVLRNLKNPVRA